MKVTPVIPEDLCGVFAVPPLARKNKADRSIDFAQNDLIVRHITTGGITRFIYGGNAFLYHVQLKEFEQLLEWLNQLPAELWAIPSIGPSYGRAMDQALLLRALRFPCAMVLPCNDPRDAAGLERGYREIADTAHTKLIVYLKDENNFGPDPASGLDTVARLVKDGVCIGIKYAVVREDPAQDSYLQELLERVDPGLVISGIGERPAVTHLRKWKLPGFTTGSGCIAPSSSQNLYFACKHEDWDTAEKLRGHFIPLENLRDAWGPARVLHHATKLAGIANTGSMPPYLSELRAEQIELLAPVVYELIEKEIEARTKNANAFRV